MCGTPRFDRRVEPGPTVLARESAQWQHVCHEAHCMHAASCLQCAGLIVERPRRPTRTPPSQRTGQLRFGMHAVRAVTGLARRIVGKSESPSIDTA